MHIFAEQFPTADSYGKKTDGRLNQFGLQQEALAGHPRMFRHRSTWLQAKNSFVVCIKYDSCSFYPTNIHLYDLSSTFTRLFRFYGKVLNEQLFTCYRLVNF